MQWKTNTSTLTTTDETESNIYFFGNDDDSVYIVESQIAAVQAGGAERASYYLRGVFYRTGGGNTTQQGATEAVATSIESDGAWDANIDASGTNVRIRVTGDAANSVYWKAITRYIIVMDDA